MRILVTGGAGFIGSHLVERLVEEGHRVLVLDDLSNGSLTNLEKVKNDIIFLKRDVSTCQINSNLDAIYHLACHPRSMSFIDPMRDVDVNVKGMVNMVETAIINKPRIIYTSNSGIYDTTKIPINEDVRDNPTTPYDINKLVGEQYLKLYAKEYGIPYVIFRLATIYGPRQRVSVDWKPVIMEFIGKLSKGEAPTIYWHGNQTRDFVFVDDVVNGLLMALESEDARKKTMILGSGVETSINQLYKIVCKETEEDITPKRGPRARGDIHNMRYDCTLARKLLGWETTITLEEGVREILRRMQG